MIIPFDQLPSSKVPVRVQEWFSSKCNEAERDPQHEFWRDALPAGSTAFDAFIASDCFWTLFSERMNAQRHTPVEAEFKL